jgi:homoserine O-acetyltransferase/O-succinyltransferase
LVARQFSDKPFDVSASEPDTGAQEPTLGVAASRGAAAQPVDGVLHLPEPWQLHHGDVLACPRVAFRLIGPTDAPVVAVLGGISAHRFLVAPEGWWPEMVGPNLGVDTTRFRVLGIDYLGGRGASSTPGDESPGSEGAGAAFPPLSAFDQAEVLHHVLAHLGLRALHAIVGASYGGMVALSFAVRHPAEVTRIVVLSAADKAQVLSTAWRSVQRQIVREAIARGDGAAGLKLARALAMATYRSQIEFATRFGGRAVRDADRFRFPVEGYLFARGDDYVQKYRAESFLTLSESIDLHHIEPAEVRTPATLVAVHEDQLVPYNDMRALAARLAGPTQLVEINSIFGHDAFLKESAVLNPILINALAEQTT